VTRPMPGRILFVSYTADWTGPTHSLLLLVTHLRPRFEVAVLSQGTGLFSEALGREGIPYFGFPSLGKSAIPAMARLIRSKGFDLVYGNNTSRSSANALVASRLARVPFICHIREMVGHGSWLRFGFLRFADATIAVSRACAQTVARFVGQRAPHVVYNGVPVAPPEVSREEARASLLEQLGWPGDAKVVIGVGHISPRKGQQDAVRALAQIASRVPAAHLALVGAFDRDSTYVRETRALARDLGLERRVALLGFRQDVQRLLPGADVFLHTAVADPHPRAVVEAMAAGLPVVAFAVDGVAETVLNGETGLLAPTGDIPALAEALATLLEWPARRDAFGRRGRQRALTHFTAEETARHVGDIIDRTLRSRRRAIAT
jgi:glycosyltransferase involved in cell wall biosynthesis